MDSETIPLDPELHKAARRGDLDLLEELLKPKLAENHAQPGEVAVEVKDGAPLQCSRSPVSCLLGVTHAGDTALHIAACFGHLKVARRICQEHVSLLTRNNEKLETPLHYAAKAGKHELVTLFIELASFEANDINLAELLRKRNKDGETALYQSVLHNHAAVVKELVCADANQSISPLASISDNKNISPLYLAIMQGQLGIVTSLIESLPDNVSRGAYAGPDGRTALHAAALRAKGFVQKVLDWKSELAKSTDKLGSTPLHYAASSGNLKVVRMIVQKNKSCAYMTDSSGLFPVHVAVKMGFVEVVAELFEQCPDSDQLLDKRGRNFVHLAVEEKNERMVRWICRRSELAEATNAQDDNGDTAIHLAVKVRDINIFARLLETKRSNLCVMNKEGLTPRDLAISKMTVGFSHWQNPDLMMVRTLDLISCCTGINRWDHFDLEYNLQFDRKKEKLVESYESMAKSMAIGSVLISSAAFTAAFSVTGAYKTDALAGRTSPGLSLAFRSFILMATYAFVCSIIATCLLVDAALTILDPTYREVYIFASLTLVKMATKGFVAAFAIGVYVVLTPVFKWLAVLLCLAGAFVIVLIQPYRWPNLLVTRALFRYLGWRGLFLGCRKSFCGNILFGIFILIVLLGSLLPTQSSFPTILVLSYGTAIMLVSVYHLFPLGSRVRSVVGSILLKRFRSSSFSAIV